VDELLWLSSTDPVQMLEDLGQRGVVSERKCRLLACNFARLVWPRIGRTGRRAVEVAELHAGGLATARPGSFYSQNSHKGRLPGGDAGFSELCE